MFSRGIVIFTIADVIAVRKGGGAGILLGIGLDTIPEALAFGASVAAGPGFVIAILIGIQNIPEGIASYREMRTGKTAFSNSKKSTNCYRNSINNSHNSWISRIILFTRNDACCWINISRIRGRDILYAIL